MWLHTAHAIFNIANLGILKTTCLQRSSQYFWNEFSSATKNKDSLTQARRKQKQESLSLLKQIVQSAIRGYAFNINYL